MPFSMVSHMNLWSIDGNAALKSSNIMAPRFDFREMICAAVSISIIFISICLPGMKLRCIAEIPCATHLSRDAFKIAAAILFAASTIESGRVPTAECIGCPSDVLSSVVLGMQHKKA